MARLNEVELEEAYGATLDVTYRGGVPTERARLMQRKAARRRADGAYSRQPALAATRVTGDVAVVTVALAVEGFRHVAIFAGGRVMELGRDELIDVFYAKGRHERVVRMVAEYLADDGQLDKLDLPFTRLHRF